MHSHLRLNCVIKLSFRASAKSNPTSRVAATTQTGRYRPSNDTRASGAMTTIRPAAIGARLREGVLTLYYPLLPRQPRICNHQLSRRPPRHWPPSAIPGSTLHSRASHVSRSALPSRPDLGGIHLIPTDAAQTGAARQQLQDFLERSRLRDITICTDLDGAAPGCRASLAPAFAAQHLPDHDTTGLAQSLGLDSGADEGALEREILLAMLGSPVPFPSRPCPSWSPPSASAAASSRPRARPPWPSTPSTPSAPRAIGPTTKNAASPSCPAARSSKACAAPRSPRPRASSTPLVLPRDRIRHRAGHRPGA